MEYQAPINDFRFLLNELFEVEKIWQELNLDIDSVLASDILEEAGKICGELIAPLNRSGDEEGVSWKDGEVTTPAGYKEAFKTYAESGWVGLGGDPQYAPLPVSLQPAELSGGISLCA